MKPEGRRVKQEAGKLRTQAAQGESPAKREKDWTTPSTPAFLPPITQYHTPTAGFPSTAQEFAVLN